MQYATPLESNEEGGLACGKQDVIPLESKKMTKFLTQRKGRIISKAKPWRSQNPLLGMLFLF